MTEVTEEVMDLAESQEVMTVEALAVTVAAMVGDSDDSVVVEASATAAAEAAEAAVAVAVEAGTTEAAFRFDRSISRHFSPYFPRVLDILSEARKHKNERRRKKESGKKRTREGAERKKW